MPADELIRHYPSLTDADRRELDALPTMTAPAGTRALLTSGSRARASAGARW